MPEVAEHSTVYAAALKNLDTSNFTYFLPVSTIHGESTSTGVSFRPPVAAAAAVLAGASLPAESIMWRLHPAGLVGN